MKITEEFLDSNPRFIKTYEFYDASKFYYESCDGRIIIKKDANLSDNAWHIHLDNSDMDTIASFDVETIEDANLILGVYNESI